MTLSVDMKTALLQHGSASRCWKPRGAASRMAPSPSRCECPRRDRDVHGQWRAVFACHAVERPGVYSARRCDTTSHPIGGRTWDFGISRTEITIGTWMSSRMRFSAVEIHRASLSFGLLSPDPRRHMVLSGCVIRRTWSAGRPVYQGDAGGAVRPNGRGGWYGAAV